MKRAHPLLLLSVVSLSLAIPASAGVRDAAFACTPLATSTAVQTHPDYLFYHGLVSPAPQSPATAAPAATCPRSKVIRT